MFNISFMISIHCLPLFHAVSKFSKLVSSLHYLPVDKGTKSTKKLQVIEVKEVSNNVPEVRNPCVTLCSCSGGGRGHLAAAAAAVVHPGRDCRTAGRPRWHQGGGEGRHGGGRRARRRETTSTSTVPQTRPSHPSSPQ